MFEVRPVEVVHITSGYGPRIIDGGLDFHEGVDFAADETTPVFAMGNGRVQAAGMGVGGDGGGNAVVIVDDHQGRLWYLHLSRIDPAIRKGARVVAGQQLGFAGRTGRVTGPHLHLEWEPDFPASTDEADIEDIVMSLPPPSTRPQQRSDDGGGLLLLGGLAAAAALFFGR